MTKYEKQIMKAEACERASQRAFAHGKKDMVDLHTRNAVALRLAAGQMTVGEAESDTDKEKIDRVVGMSAVVCTVIMVVLAIAYCSIAQVVK